MFSALFKRKKDQRNLKPKPEVVRWTFSTMIQSYRESCEREWQNEQEERQRIYILEGHAKSLFDEIMFIKKSCVQGLTSYLKNSLARLHNEAIGLLFLDEYLFLQIAKMNSLSILSYLGKNYCSPWLVPYRTCNCTVYFFNSSCEIPEYIFSSNCLKNFSGDREYQIQKRCLVFARIALEVFIASSLAVQWLMKRKLMSTSLLRRIMENGGELEFLLNCPRSTEDFVNFELSREEKIINATFEQRDKVIVPCVQPFKVDSNIDLACRSKQFSELSENSLCMLDLDLDDFEASGQEENYPKKFDDETDRIILEFIDHLKENNYDFNLINIYLALALCKATNNEQHTPKTSELLWALMKKCYPRHEPFIAMAPDEKKVEICIQENILEHRGLSMITSNPQTIQEISFIKNNCPNIRRILPKLQDFFDRE